jgi:quercetin dioxygenase-like cupin family protein
MPFYRLTDLAQEVISPQYSRAIGGTVTGEKIEIGLYRMPAGTGAAPHRHPNEQIIYLLSGRVRARVGDETQEAGPGTVIHVPPNSVHEMTALEDVQFLSSKDLVDGKGSKGWSAQAPVPPGS